MYVADSVVCAAANEGVVGASQNRVEAPAYNRRIAAEVGIPRAAANEGVVGIRADESAFPTRDDPDGRFDGIANAAADRAEFTTRPLR